MSDHVEAWLLTQQILPAPAEEAIKYEKWRFNATLVIDSPYNGPPGEEVDEAWRELLHSKSFSDSPGAKGAEQKSRYEHAFARIRPSKTWNDIYPGTGS